MPSSQTSSATATPSRVYDRQENSLRISLNDLRERKTSNGKDDDPDDHGENERANSSVAVRQKQVNSKSAKPEHVQRGTVAGGGVPNTVSAFINEEYGGDESDVNDRVYTENQKNLCTNCLRKVQISQEFQNFNCPQCVTSQTNPCGYNSLTNEERIRFKIQEQERNLEISPVEPFRNTETRVYLENSTSENHSCNAQTLRSYFDSSESDYSPTGLRRNCWNLMQNWPERTSSVPNELNSLGRKKKYKRTRNKIPPQASADLKNEIDDRLSESLTSSEDNAEEDLLSSRLPNLKRSSSWCFESTQSSKLISPTATNELQEFPYSLQEPPQKLDKNLGFIHQSYHNLALLDLDSICNTEASKMAEKRTSSDYETDIVCKSNFLLDELSAHYDKTASILNDRPVSSEKEAVVEPVVDVVDYAQETKPKPPQRRRRSSNSSYSETENTDDDQVQHVSLVIRKPPARQKRNQQQEKEKSNSLTQDFTFSALMQANKTFDQDPTILQTSYAQSLEKCNFDCREISNTDLTRTRTMPKRRFHSQANSAKKKNMVSSTPNLNAYQGDDQDIEDDMYVSSATTSMHQLPGAQTQKPLGILLPAGSRTSFGKEVSFCPVVSKYSWQEQSSEECHDDLEVPIPSVVPGEESDDEILDNCDAVVIKNTKENEIIGSLYKDAEALDESQHEATPKERVTMCSEENDMKEKYKAVIKELPTLTKTRSDGKEQVKEHKENEEYSEERANERASLTSSERPLLVMETREESQVNVCSNVVPFAHSETLDNETNADDDAVTEFITTATFSLTTNVNNETLKAKPDTATTISSTTSVTPSVIVKQEQIPEQQQEQQQQQKRVKAVKPTIVIARPISIQLPILSEPPINRAHHILYASQQMLDNFQRHQESENYEHSTKSQSVQNLNRMSSSSSNNNNAATMTSAATGSGKINNNNEIMKSKFKADEKHPNSKGFLSRLSNGFRFSMRRNKKKLQKDSETNANPPNTQVAEPVLVATKKVNGSTPVKSSKSAAKNSSKATGNNNQQPDYIYIPLKGPLPEKYETGFFESHHQNGNTDVKVTAVPATANGNSSANKLATVTKKGGKQSKTNGEEKKVTGKPPLPPQQQQQMQQQKTQSANSSQPQQMGSSRFYTQELSSADGPQPSQQPPTIRGSTEDFLASERYHSQRHDQSFANDAEQHNAMTASAAVNYDFGASPSRASVSQKTQMFNNLSSRNSAVEPKIGLIETNLDTHETVITGKTRSLINIGPNQNASGKRHTSAVEGHHHHHAGDHHHGDYYDDNDDDEVVVRPDGSVVVIKNAGSNGAAGSQAQIASVRRPHKSMEFLLDKENQKDVMVSQLNGRE